MISVRGYHKEIPFPLIPEFYPEMPDFQKVLDSAVSHVQRDPHSAAALTIYALMNTMEYEQAGCLFKLNKLRALGRDDRLLAYDLMEAMVAGVNQKDAWISARHRMDKAIREG